MSISDFLSRFPRVKRLLDGSHMAPCPGHADRTPSLHITATSDRILLKCHAGCSTDAVLATMGLVAADLFFEKSSADSNRTPAPRGAAVRKRVSARPDRRTIKRITRYELRDPEGRFVAVHVREDRPGGKRMWWECLHGKHGLDGRGTAGLPLYGAHLLLNRPNEPVIFVEGEKAAQALLDAGRLAVGTVTGAAGTPSDGTLRPLVGRDVVVWPDNDDPGHGHMRRIATAIARLGGECRWVEWTEAPTGGDAADFVQQHGAGDALDALLAAIAPYRDEAPSLADLLEKTETFLRRYVAFQSPHQPVACALWTAYTYTADAFDVAPYLSLSSPEMNSGKTRCLEAESVLVRSPWLVAEASTAVIFRKLDKHRPTLLFDEVDAVFTGKDERNESLRAVLNAGYRRGTPVARCVGEGAKQDLVDFEVFGPKAFAGIGKLPATIASRSIPIRLARIASHERVAKWREKRARAEAASIRDALASWAASAVPVLRDAQPDVPDVGNDRVEEIWEPLLAIADLAGGNWPKRARAAIAALHFNRADLDETTGTLFLRAIRSIFDELKVNQISTERLLDALVDRDDTPASEWWAKPLKDGDTRGPARRLANRLRAYGIEPTKWREGAETVRGYRRSDFGDAWARYLPSSSPLNGDLHATDATTLDVQGPAADSVDATTAATEALTPQRNPMQDKVCGVVASGPSEGRDLEDCVTAHSAAARSHLRTLAELWEWPRIYLGFGETIPAGLDAWALFMTTASADRIAWAIADLESLETGRR